MKGIERSIDKLGRIVLPISFREQLGLEANEKVTILLEGDKITLYPTNKICALCGNKITTSNDIRICDTCIDKIRKNENSID